MEHECPQDGDIANDCQDCVYRNEYLYSPILRDCIELPEISEERNKAVSP